jgi:hypothetical protein
MYKKKSAAKSRYVGFEVLGAVVTNNDIFRVVMPFSLLKVN